MWKIHWFGVSWAYQRGEHRLTSECVSAKILSSTDRTLSYSFPSSGRLLRNICNCDSLLNRTTRTFLYTCTVWLWWNGFGPSCTWRTYYFHLYPTIVYKFPNPWIRACASHQRGALVLPGNDDVSHHRAEWMVDQFSLLPPDEFLGEHNHWWASFRKINNKFLRIQGEKVLSPRYLEKRKRWKVRWFK